MSLIDDILDQLISGQQSIKNSGSTKNLKFLKRNSKIGALIIGAIVLLPQSIYTLGSGEEAIILRLGKHVQTVTKAGLNLKIPFIDTTYKVNVKEIRRLEFGYRTETKEGSIDVPDESLMLTGDENLVNLDTTVQYSISDSEKYLFNVNNPIETLRVVAESEIRRGIANHTLDEVLTDNKFEIQQEVTQDLQKVCDKYNLGIKVNTFELQDVNPPAEVEEAFKDVAGAKEDKNSYVNEANSYKNEVVPKSRGNASQILNEAEAYKEDRIERAKGDVASFVQILDKYKGQKEITRTRMYLETLEEVLPGLDKYIVDEGSGTIKFLPLGNRTDNTSTKEGGSN